jgi:hypothetical protein
MIAPSAASAALIAPPIPREPPVTIATRPSKEDKTLELG